MNNALETLYAMRIIFWCQQDQSALHQINQDIESLKMNLKGVA